MKHFSQLAVLFSFLMLCITSVNAQAKKSNSLKLVQDKPSVYITFDRKGKAAPLFEGESPNRIWLRLHNNTKLNAFLCIFDVEKQYGEKGVYYSVGRMSRSVSDKQIPLGYESLDNCKVFILSSGKNLLFSLPAEKLAKDLLIKVPFNYGWSNDWNEDMFEGVTSFVAFGSSEIPL